MRIIGGKFKGRRFHPPAEKWPTRPTTDFSKEALFNILNNRIDFEDTKMLDLFGGTGNHSYEFISRGCEDVTYVDKFPGCVRFAKETARHLQIESYIHIVQMDVFQFINTCKLSFSYIFAGPPYGLANLDDIPNLIFEHQLLQEDGIFVLEHNPHHDFKKHTNYIEERHYGQTIFSFFEHLPKE